MWQCTKYSTLSLCGFSGLSRMGTVPTSIEVLLRPTQSQSDEPSDLLGSHSHKTTVHACPSVYGTWQSQAVTLPIMNPARRCLTSVIEPTPMSQRHIPHNILLLCVNSVRSSPICGISCMRNGRKSGGPNTRGGGSKVELIYIAKAEEGR